VKVLFGNFWDLHDAGWRTLTIRLTIFFLFLAVMNEVVWRNFSTDLWVNVKVFGFTGITMVFFMAQVPLLTRSTIKDDTSNEG
jgi:intracellular septation protein